MQYMLGNLEPKQVFRHFEDLSRIPRESNNEREISDFLMRFAKTNGLDATQDGHLNVIIRKPASKGHEAAPTVILQGHMDMVCVKDAASAHDFLTDPLELSVDGDLVRAKGTSLGADNGIAVAMAMAILEDTSAEHPALEAVFTVAEEVGLDGAANLDGKMLTGKVLINIDSEEEGVFLSSCAGGVRNYVHLPVRRTPPAGDRAFRLSVKGLLGGHSGMEIDKNRANAIRLLGRTLAMASETASIEVAAVRGGEKDNAIARSAEAEVVVKSSASAAFLGAVGKAAADFGKEFETADPGLAVVAEEMPLPRAVFAPETLDSFVTLARTLPNGIDTMSNDLKGLVVSSCNMGVLETDEDEVRIVCALRSSVKSLKRDLSDRIAAISRLAGATVESKYDYPEWQYSVKSPIRDLMTKVWLDTTGKAPKVDAIHAGLECGFFGEKIGGIDMVSIGPNVHDVHTVAESLEIGSTARTYGFLTEVLRRMVLPFPR